MQIVGRTRTTEKRDHEHIYWTFKIENFNMNLFMSQNGQILYGLKSVELSQLRE